MSPEQAWARAIDKRSDIFALATVLFELLTGRKLFTGDNELSILEQVREARITPPSQYNDEVTPQIDAIVIKALQKDPAARYQTAGEMERDINQVLYSFKPTPTAADLAIFMHRLSTSEPQPMQALSLPEPQPIREPGQLKPAAAPAAAAGAASRAGAAAASDAAASRSRAAAGRAGAATCRSAAGRAAAAGAASRRAAGAAAGRGAAGGAGARGRAHSRRHRGPQPAAHDAAGGALVSAGGAHGAHPGDGAHERARVGERKRFRRARDQGRPAAHRGRGAEHQAVRVRARHQGRSAR